MRYFMIIVGVLFMGLGWADEESRISTKGTNESGRRHESYFNDDDFLQTPVEFNAEASGTVEEGDPEFTDTDIDDGSESGL